MQKLIDKIKTIPKSYFSLMDIRKIARTQDQSLKVALSRLVKDKKIYRLGSRYYSTNLAQIDWEQFAEEVYAPSYLSFESALARYGILSQQPRHLTLATTKRTKTITTPQQDLLYHHLNPDLFWGYINDGSILIAEPEKALLDLAYLSLNGYAKFDPEELNWQLLDNTKLSKYIAKFKSKTIHKLIRYFQ